MPGPLDTARNPTQGSGCGSPSALERAAIQDVLAVCGMLRKQDNAETKQILDRIVGSTTRGAAQAIRVALGHCLLAVQSLLSL